jgi:hypothetical protein
MTDPEVRVALSSYAFLEAAAPILPSQGHRHRDRTRYSELGRFAHKYRRIFGETPFKTLTVNAPSGRMLACLVH